MLLYKKSEPLVNQNCQVHHHLCVPIFDTWQLGRAVLVIVGV